MSNEKTRVIKVDNFDREGPGFDDTVVCDCANEATALFIAEALNKNRAYSSDYYKAVPKNYKLKVFEP